MKRDKVEIVCNDVEMFPIITCPVCGFTFRLVDLKKKKNCPMCGYDMFRKELKQIMAWNNIKYC